MNAGGNMVFMGGGISAGGNARLSAGGDLLLLAYDTGRQVRSHSPRDESGNPTGRGPVWSFENSTYNQTGVNINVGGSLSASAGGNLVAQGTNADVGGSTRLSAGGDMSLTTALSGHVQSYNFFNRYKTSGGLIKVEHSIDQRDTNLTHSGNTWNSGGAMNLSAGGDISLVGAQINAQGYRARAGGNYEERAAYDINERVSSQSTRSSGIGTYLADFHNNITWLTTGGEHGGRTETFRATTNIDSTRTATVTHINAGSGTVTRNVGGDAFIEGSIVRGSVVNPLTAGGRITAAAAVDSRHIENSVSTGTIRWQSTQSTGSIEQTLHMPQIHGTIPAGMSAYQGAGGVSVQLPAGSSVRTAIEQLSQEPGKGYLRDLGNRSDIDWQRVQVLNQSLDFSKSGLTKEATIVVIIVVSFLTYGAASSAGTAAGNTVAVSAGEGVALSGGGTFLTGTGATVSGATGAAVTAGVTSLASTAAVSLINNQGDIGATLKELGSKENLQGLLLTMATAGLTQGILSNIPLDGASTLANVNAKSSIELLLARNAIQGLTSAVLESAVMGTSLEEAIKSNLQSALINTVAAKGANQIGDAQLDSTSKAIAHALLGCAVGAANAGNSSGCAPGAAGAAIGEIVAGLYADASGYDQLRLDANQPGASAGVQQQLAVATNTMTQLARLTGAGAALLIGGDASTMNIAMNTAANAAQNNRQLHTNERALIEQLAAQRAQQVCAGNPSCDVVKVAAQYSDAMERVAEMRVDSMNEQQSREYLTQLAQSAQQTGTVAQMGGFDAYVNLLVEAGQMLSPYTGQPIVVNGQAARDNNGQTQTYFSATERQRQNPYLNTVLNQAPGSVTPGMAGRDENRLENLQAITGSATPIYPVEDILLGGAIGGRLGSAFDTIINGRPITVYRVEGAPNSRLVIGNDGSVAITGDQTLFLNFGSRDRAEEFLALRISQNMTDPSIRSFQVTESFFNDIRESAVPESLARQNPGKPILVDPSRAANQFGLRPEQFDSLINSIIPSTGKLEK